MCSLLHTHRTIRWIFIILTNQVPITISDTMKLVPLVKSDRTKQVPLVSSANFLLLSSASREIWQNENGADDNFWHNGSGAPRKIWRLGAISVQIGPFNLKYLRFGEFFDCFYYQNMNICMEWKQMEKEKKGFTSPLSNLK